MYPACPLLTGPYMRIICITNHRSCVSLINWLLCANLLLPYGDEVRVTLHSRVYLLVWTYCERPSHPRFVAWSNQHRVFVQNMTVLYSTSWTPSFYALFIELWPVWPLRTYCYARRLRKKSARFWAIKWLSILSVIKMRRTW